MNGIIRTGMAPGGYTGVLGGSMFGSGSCRCVNLWIIINNILKPHVNGNTWLERILQCISAEQRSLAQQGMYLHMEDLNASSHNGGAVGCKPLSHGGAAPDHALNSDCMKWCLLTLS